MPDEPKPEWTGEGPEPHEPGPTLEYELAKLLNRHCQENASNTPDFILAHYLTDCLKAWEAAIKHRASWYGHIDAPGGLVPFAVIEVPDMGANTQ